MQIRPLVGIPSPRGPVCHWRKRFYWCGGGGSGRGWRNSGGGWGARGQSWVGLPALPSVTVVGDGLTGEVGRELMSEWGRTPPTIHSALSHIQ